MRRPVDRHLRQTIMCPTQAPSAQAVYDATALLHHQWLAVYQTLYAAGLTTPGTRGTPFRVERSVDTPACIEVTPAYAGYDEYQFRVRTPEEIAGVVVKCELIIAALEEDRQRVHHQACCPFAVQQDKGHGIVSFACVLHGTRTTWAE